jgi:hypothetical protein
VAVAVAVAVSVVVAVAVGVAVAVAVAVTVADAVAVGVSVGTSIGTGGGGAVCWPGEAAAATAHQAIRIAPMKRSGPSLTVNRQRCGAIAGHHSTGRRAA